MTRFTFFATCWLFLCFLFPALAQQPGPASEVIPPPVSTRHQVTIQGRAINYTATTGYMMLKDESGKDRAKVFFIAYVKENEPDPSKRPVTFTFNGGPGSSSVWLHMGGLGPKRIVMTPEGNTTPPPYQWVDNEYSWLDRTDLVFIDPVMTGYSRPAEGKDKSEFTGYTNDIETVGEFIRLYTTRYKRWASPKFLAGESYGTTRAAGLSGFLQTRYGMFINGTMLISAILNFQTVRESTGNDLPFPLHLPTFAATAWYHKQVPAYTDLKTLLADCEEFALGTYMSALAKGDKITEAERNAIIDQLHKFTGLSKTYLDQTNLRLSVGRFNKELLRVQKRTVGRLDSRFTGIDYDAAGESYEYDPSYNTAIYGPYTTAINDYLRRTLGYENDIPYEILTGRVRPWSYSNVENQYLNVSETLRSAMSQNPSLHVWVANGYYDMATPYFATEYTFNHMFVDPSLKKNITMTYYEAGHMMYIHLESLKQFRRDFVTFMDKALVR